MTAQLSPARGAVRIGISGWRYKGWRGVFYPQELVQRRELEFASRQFDTIELNGSFYSLQHPRSFLRWYRETPPGFIFSIKGSRYITHMLRLRNVELPLARFFNQGILDLNEKLGPVLWQFPPNFSFDLERLDSFFALLPKTRLQAAALVRSYLGRDSSMREGSEDGPAGEGGHSAAKDTFSEDAPLRHAIEIRHESFVSEEFIALLRGHSIALVAADTVEWPLLVDATADFVYCRLHGSEQLYASSYNDQALDLWANRIFSWSRGESLDAAQCAGDRAQLASRRKPPRRRRRDVYVYFDNDMKVKAPFDARRLRERVAKLLCS